MRHAFKTDKHSKEQSRSSQLPTATAFSHAAFFATHPQLEDSSAAQSLTDQSCECLRVTSYPPLFHPTYFFLAFLCTGSCGEMCGPSKRIGKGSPP